MLCAPVLVYLVIAVLGFLATMAKSQNSVASILFIAFWAFIIQKLCSRGNSGVAWLFVFLPVIIPFIMVAHGTATTAKK